MISKYRNNIDMDNILVKNIDGIKCQWNLRVKTASKVYHHKPHMSMWNNMKKVCAILEFSCPSDVNISKNQRKAKQLRATTKKHENRLTRIWARYITYKLGHLNMYLRASSNTKKILALNRKMLRSK